MIIPHGATTLHHRANTRSTNRMFNAIAMLWLDAPFFASEGNFGSGNIFTTFVPESVFLDPSGNGPILSDMRCSPGLLETTAVALQ
jgi:hypothetical protein